MSVESPNDEFFGELWLTLIVTIVSSLLTWVFVLVVQRIISPWYENLTYKGIRLDGNWQSTTSSTKEVTHHESMTIKQRGHLLSGSYSVKNELKNSNPIISNYRIEGRIINSHVTISCFIVSQQQIGMVQFLLEINEGGNALKGSALWINRAENDIRITKDYKIFKE